MNIFYLDDDIKTCAQYHTDKHVVKMILESTQMLCSALWANGQSASYKPTHKNHPCTLWVSASLSNWLWLRELVTQLHAEWQYRFNHTKHHKSYDVAMSLELPKIANLGITKRPMAMPDFYKKENVIEAYRLYYIKEKCHLFKWSKREIPHWIKGGLQ